MPQTREVADAFGVVTIVLFVIFALLGLFCIVQSIYLCTRTRKAGFLSFFNGPSLTRIVLVLIMLWWGIGEIFRSSIVTKQLFPAVQQQRSICNAYILSNMGFAEPAIFFIFALLLRGSLQRKELGALSSWWNRRTLFYSFLMCAAVFLVQSLLVFSGPVFIKEENSSGRTKIANYFVRTSHLVNGSRLCTYPLFGTIVLGLVYAILMSYVSYIGSKILLSVINKRLLRRVSLLMSAVLFLLPLRVVLLGFSVLPHPGDVSYEVLIFLSFLTMLSCMTIGILILVYFPVADSLNIGDGDAARLYLNEMVPLDEYYGNRSFRDAEMISEVSTKCGSISFRTMIREDQTQMDGSFSYQGALHIGSPLCSLPSAAARPMLPLMETPSY